MPNRNDDKSIDLSGALKSSGPRQSLEEPRRAEWPADDYPKMTGFIIRHSGGLIKTSVQANYVLLFFSAIAIIFSFYLFFGAGNEQVIIIRPAV